MAMSKKNGCSSMKVEIIQRTENKSLAREEIAFRIEGADKTPTRAEVRKKIAALINANEQCLVVDGFSLRFGSPVVFGSARVYRSEDAMKKIELKSKIRKNFGSARETAAAQTEGDASGAKVGAKTSESTPA